MDVPEVGQVILERTGADTGLTFPSPKGNYMFPSEVTFNAAAKLLGPLEKKAVESFYPLAV